MEKMMFHFQAFLTLSKKEEEKRRNKKVKCKQRCLHWSGCDQTESQLLFLAPAAVLVVTYFILTKTNLFTSAHLIQSVAGQVSQKYDCS